MEGSFLYTLMPAVAIWTLLASVVLSAFRWFKFPDALTRYHISAATLMALPLGIAAAWLTDVSWLLPASVSLPSFAGSFMAAAELPAVTVFSGTETAESTSSAQGWSIPWSALISGFFVMMSVAGLVRLAVIYIRLKAALRRADIVTRPHLLQMSEQIRREIGIKREVLLCSSPDISVPFTSGFLRTLIVIPESRFAEGDDSGLRMILRHEMVHISRADYPVHVAELFIRHLFWMHPLVHKLYHQSGYWREVACDAAVLNNTETEPGNYARLLYEFALGSKEKPVFRAAMAQEHKLLKRIREIHAGSEPYHPKHTRPVMKKSIVSAAAILFLFAGAMACSDLAKGPEAETYAVPEDELEFLDETINVGQLRDMIVQLRTGYEDELKLMQEGELPESEHRVPEIVKEQIDELNNLLMLVDNGRASRAVAGLEQMMNSSPPPPPSPPSAPTRGDDDVFTVVEEMPQMSGGQMSLYNRLTYPQEARDQGLEGRVILQFIVEKDGSISDLQVARSAGDILDEAAFDAMSGVEFSPGLQRGEPVRVQMVMPIVFRLQ